MKVCCDTEGRELTDERRYAPTSVPLRRKPCSRSPETLFHFTGIPIHTQNHRVVRRVEVQPDDVAHFLDEERIGRQLEGLRPMRLDPEQGEPALYRALANALGSPQGACAPVRGGVGRLLQCTVDHRRHLVVVIGPGPTGSEFVVQALDTGCSEAPSPLADGLWCDAEAEGDRRVGQAFGAGENHACPLDQGVGQGGRPGNSVELILLLVGEREWYQWASEWHGSLPCLKPAAYDTHFRDCTLGTRIDDVGRRLDTLAADVKSVDRRVARLEGWLERDRLGAAPDTGATP